MVSQGSRGSELTESGAKSSESDADADVLQLRAAHEMQVAKFNQQIKQLQDDNLSLSAQVKKKLQQTVGW